jgi:formimidoylglutamate deiminase
MGVAPHSLRAVSREGLAQVERLLPDAPFHLHLAEQVAEVDEIKAAYGARPVEWLLDNYDVNERWCLIHVTQMNAGETVALAKTGAIAGLCPITESSLGDGIFDGMRYREAGGRFGIGSDSNIRISLSEELRTLEYSQRLSNLGRAMFATPEKSTGRVLLDQVAASGATAANRDTGVIAVGRQADLLALDMDATDLLGKTGDMLLDSYIFAGSDALVTDVWSAGRQLVKDGVHVRRSEIVSQYRDALKTLMEKI